MKTYMLLLTLCVVWSCGPSKQEQIKRRQEVADSLARVQLLRDDSIKQAAIIEEKKRAKALDDATEKLHECNYTIMELQQAINHFQGEIDIAKANLQEVSRVRLLVSLKQREKDIKAWSEKIRNLEQGLEESKAALDKTKKEKKRLEEIVGKSDDTIIYD